jgi:hypothetical protein
MNVLLWSKRQVQFLPTTSFFTKPQQPLRWDVLRSSVWMDFWRSKDSQLILEMTSTTIIWHGTGPLNLRLRKIYGTYCSNPSSIVFNSKNSGIRQNGKSTCSTVGSSCCHRLDGATWMNADLVHASYLYRCANQDISNRGGRYSIRDHKR